MAINWDLYNTRLNINGSSNRERNLQALQNNITNKLPDSLSYKAVKINNVDSSIEIVKTTKDYIKVIHSLQNASFDCGDYVLYNGKTYLITEIDADDDVYTSGKMQECTFVLKFQSLSGTILSYPCIDESSNTVGIDESPEISTLNSIKRIKLPFDENTKLLDIDRRLFVDDLSVSKPKTYAITDPNRTEFRFGNKGLIILTMKSDLYNELTDRKDLGVCNYFIPTPDPQPIPTATYAVVTCSSQDNNIPIGSSVYRTLTPVFYNSNDTINTSVIAVWNFDYPVGFESYFTVVYSGNLAKIKVAEDPKYALLGKTIVAKVSNGSGGYSGSISLTITM